MGIADKLFDWDGADDHPPEEADAIALLKEHSVPFESIGWDHYDSSLEIYGAAQDWRMPQELQAILYKEGFVKVYVNHTDYWETHYSFGTLNGFEAQPGWRVSYPHKRPNDDGQIWVERAVPSWPKEWFQKAARVFGKKRSGPYVLVKPTE